MHIASPKVVGLAGFVVLFGAAVGCSSAGGASDGWGDDGTSDDGGSGSQDDGGGSGGYDGGTSGDSGNPGSGGHDGGGGGGGSQDSSTGVDSGGGGGGGADSGGTGQADSGSVTSSDGFSAARTACINKINALRATDTAVALQPLTLENVAATNMCVDTQASNDQAMNSAHYSFINNAPACMWGNANGWGQNECEEGYGTTVAGIEQCLQDMWDESLKPHCLGCVGCTAFGGACANCDFSGTMGYECGHYVNMSAPYFTSVACGFAGAAPSSSTGWSVQNFE